MSQTNHIESLRTEVREWFDLDGHLAEHDLTETSPDGRYELQCRWFGQTDPERNWDVIVVRVVQASDGSIVAEFTTNHCYSYHTWVTKNDCDYLIFPEALSGESVLDLTNRRLSSYHNGGDGFIWTSFFPSPTGRWLAVQGCVWACPDSVVIYDFSRPLELPLPRVQNIWADHHVDFVGWTADDDFELSDGRKLSVTSPAPPSYERHRTKAE